MKREKEELQTQIIQLKRKQGEDKKTMNGKEKKGKMETYDSNIKGMPCKNQTKNN